MAQPETKVCPILRFVPGGCRNCLWLGRNSQSRYPVSVGSLECWTRMAVGAAITVGSGCRWESGAPSSGCRDCRAAQQRTTTTSRAPQIRAVLQGRAPATSSAMFDAAAKALGLTHRGAAREAERRQDHDRRRREAAERRRRTTVIDAMIDADRERIEDIVNNPWPAWSRSGSRRRPGGPEKPGGFGMGFGGFGRFGATFDDLAKALEHHDRSVAGRPRAMARRSRKSRRRTTSTSNTVITRSSMLPTRRSTKRSADGKLTEEQATRSRPK